MTQHTRLGVFDAAGKPDVVLIMKGGGKLKSYDNLSYEALKKKLANAADKKDHDLQSASALAQAFNLQQGADQLVVQVQVFLDILQAGGSLPAAQKWIANPTTMGEKHEYVLLQGLIRSLAVHRMAIKKMPASVLSLRPLLQYEVHSCRSS